MLKLNFRFASLVSLWLSLLFYSVWSFSLTDPNLVFTSWEPYWRVQNWLWENLFKNSAWLTISYSIILVMVWLSFGWVWYQSKFWQFSWKKLTLIWLITISPLLLSNNALSHDVFNYIFNAKMVLAYQANPHIQVALDFPADPLTRFMHNTHTVAPYGYGWTAFSLLPSWLSFGKFVLAWWWFRWLSVAGIVALIWVLTKLHQQLFRQPISVPDLVLVIFNPLLIIELISNSHNDIWMIMPAMVALYLAGNWANKVRPDFKQLILSLFLLVFSISTKFVTIVLIPIWITTVAWPFPAAQKLREQITSELKKISHQVGSQVTWAEFWPLLASFVMFLPLTIERSKQFLPWYLIWILVWLPLIKLNWWRQVILAFSVSSMLRYIPALLSGFSGDVTSTQKAITWIIPIIWLMVVRALEHNKFKKTNLIK